jgi:hypothetical protein
MIREVGSRGLPWASSFPARIGQLALSGALPAFALASFASSPRGEDVAFDFRPYDSPAGAILNGRGARTRRPATRSPRHSGTYVHPPLARIVTLLYEVTSPARVVHPDS